MQKLTKDQIEDLYAFTRKHFVEWYDLQTELVDHLANDIEAVWEENPNVSYEVARDQAFKKFGVFGFMDVIEKRRKAMSKKYMKYLYSELKKWFELPQILATIALFLFFVTSFSSSISEYLFISFYLILMVWSARKSIILNREFRKRKEVSNKKWLLEEMIFKQAGGVGFVFLTQFGNVFHYSDTIFTNQYTTIIVALISTFFCLFNFISFQILPSKAEKLLKDTYPEFSL